MAASASFGTRLAQNTTGFADSLFLGPPDGSSSNDGTAWVGIGGQVVAYFFDAVSVLDGPGGDFNLYEVDYGLQEFGSISVAVSLDAGSFVDISASEGPGIAVDNDPGHTSGASFVRSYDLAASGLGAVRYVRIDGDGSGAAGGTSGFDLDAIGAVNFAPVPLPGTALLLASAVPDGLGLRARRRA